MIQHSVHDNDNRVVLGDECRRLGIGDFCARMVCQIDGTSNGRKGVILRYHILLFPVNADDLQESPECRYAGWPGIRIAEGTMPFGPKPTEPWRCPCVPFIRPGAPYSEIPSVPASDRLRAAIAAIMRNSGQPDLVETGFQAITKWDRIRANPREMVNIFPNITWPRHVMPQNDRGEYAVFIYSIVRTSYRLEMLILTN
jgi:hypothetical protein